jgi:AcrR family transcriptional regulator
MGVNTESHSEPREAMQERGSGLPGPIEAAWGLRGRPVKGPRPGLSLDRIVEAGVKVADAEGLAAVSMGRVAAELSSSAMALYRYVRSKDELLALMVDACAHPLPELDPGAGWRAGLEGWAWAERAMYRRHPWILRVPISGPPALPGQLAWLERGLAALGGTGLEEGEKLSIILLLTGYVRNAGMLEADIGEVLRSGDQSALELMTGYGRVLRRLLDRDRYPALHAVIDAGVFEEEDEPDYDFIFGLQRVLDGIGALISRRQGTDPAP